MKSAQRQNPSQKEEGYQVKTINCSSLKLGYHDEGRLASESEKKTTRHISLPVISFPSTLPKVLFWFLSFMIMLDTKPEQECDVY